MSLRLNGREAERSFLSGVVETGIVPAYLQRGGITLVFYDLHQLPGWGTKGKDGWTYVYVCMCLDLEVMWGQICLSDFL